MNLLTYLRFQWSSIRPRCNSLRTKHWQSTQHQSTSSLILRSSLSIHPRSHLHGICAYKFNTSFTMLRISTLHPHLISLTRLHIVDTVTTTSLCLSNSCCHNSYCPFPIKPRSFHLSSVPSIHIIPQWNLPLPRT